MFIRFLCWAACLVVLGLAPSPARACSCAHPNPTDYLRSLDQIFDGYIEDITRDETDRMMKATVRVQKVWKGVLPDTIIFAYGEADAACQFGRLREHISFRFHTRGDPARFLGASWCDRMIASPQNVDLTRELYDYVDRRQALGLQAAAGGVDDKLIFAHFLLDHGDEPQALSTFQLIIDADQGNADAWLGLGHTLAKLGRAEELAKALAHAASLDQSLQGDVLRANFEATGFIDPSWKDWSNLRTGSGCKVINMELRDATFGGSELHNCSFDSARLSNIDFTGARLFRASFDGGTLRDVRFRNVTLQASFLGADIADVELSGQIGGDFGHARLSRVNGTGARGELGLRGAQISDSDFSTAYLAYMDAREATFDRVNLAGADLMRAKLQGADLRGAILTGAKLDMAHVNCETRLLPGIDIRAAGIISEEPVCDGKPQNRDFSGRAWEHADFTGLDLRGANFSGSNLRLADFRNADLTGADLSGIEDLGGLGFLSGAILESANLNNASSLDQLGLAKSLKGATFRGVSLYMRHLVSSDPTGRSVNLDEPNFDGAELDCTYDLEWIGRNKEYGVRQGRTEIAAMATICAKWPSVTQSERCIEAVRAFQAEYRLGSAISATP